MESPDEDEVFARYYAAKKAIKKVKRHLSFNERIAQMGGDNGRFSRKLNTETSFETFFEDAIDNWRSEDQGPDLESFVMAIQTNELKTYAQLLHKADQIFNALVEHITKPESQSIPALCGILSAFARDLREKFNKYCWKAFEVLINILDLGNRNAENVEAAYICFSILVKIQAAQLSKQMKKTFTNFLPLFASSRDFVRRFAAESFAYLLRKSSDIRGLALYISRQAFKTPHYYLSDGCALLFYNTYVGIAGIFHSNCSQFLKEIVSGLISAGNDDSEEFNEFCIKILVQMIGYTIEYSKNSSGENKYFYQNVLTKILGESKNNKEATNLMRLLLPCIVEKNEELMNEVTRKRKKKEKENKKNKGKKEFKNVVKVEFVCGDELKKSLEKVVRIENFQLNDHIVEFISQTVLTIFNDDKNRLFARDITLKIAEIEKDYDTVIDLLLKLIGLDSFDLYLMPSLGKIADDIIKNKKHDADLMMKVTSFYSYLCSQRRNIKQTIDITSRSNFFDLSNHYTYRDWLISNFETKKRSTLDTESLIDMICAWPWLYSQSDVVKGADNVLELLKERISSDDSSILNCQLVFACVSGIYLTKRNLLKNIKKEEIEAFLTRSNCSESSLLAFELFLDVYGVSEDVEYMNRVAELTSPAFFSSNSDVRITALKTLCKFKLPLPVQIDEDGKKKQQEKSAFEVMYEAECSELTNFRERLLQFRKLRNGQHKEFIPVGSSEKVEKIIVTELLSQFFVNFTPLWKGVQEILGTFANGMNIDTFWGVVSDWIGNVNKNIKENISNDCQTTGRLIGVDTTNRSDFVKARIQLFEFFETIPNIAERRTRILSPLMLSIYGDFLRLTSKTVQLDIVEEQNEQEGQDEEVQNEEDETADEVEVELVEHQEKDQPKDRHEIAHILKALNTLMNVFAKFNAAKATYMESKLLDMYENLLASKYEGLQGAALSCIFSYRNSILAQYRENLEGVINEKTLRSSLTYFKLSEDEGDAQVIDEHRSVVVPILLRILRGKLLINGKRKGMVSRRNGLIYVIGGCRSEELTFFLKLYFSQIFEIFGNDASFEDVENKCSNKEFLSNINLKVLISVLQGVSEMIKKIARSMGENEERMILNVTLICGIVCKYMVKKEGNLEIVKNLRMSVCDRLSEFFNAFPNREFSAEEMKVVKDSILSPFAQNISKNNVVERDGIPVPVPPYAIVKLISSICRLPSLYQLLLINIEFSVENKNTKRICDVLDLLLAPLSWPGCNEIMMRTIRNSLIKLSELADEDIVQISNLVKCAVVEPKKGYNFGTAILRTKIRVVLDFLTAQIEKEVSTAKRPANESITLLERFSDFVAEYDDIPNRLATPLFMCIERRKCNEETSVNMMKSLAKIAPLLKEPQQFFTKFPRLFAMLEGRTLRDGLVEMVEGFVKSENVEKDTREMLHFLCELDAWDRTKIDEPHFERRYAAYNALMKIWNEEDEKKNVDLVILAMFVSTHFACISTTTDLSLRMTAGNNVRALVEYSGKKLPADEKRQFLGMYLSPTIVSHLKHDGEAVREEAISTFAVTVKSFKENQHLAEIDGFSNDDDDMDFLKNMNHIQVHRRQRAIKRLIEAVESGEKVLSFNTMNKYLIPMIHPYLINYSAKFNALSDESLRLVKLAMSKATWGKYCSYLESWLTKVEKAATAPDEKFTDRALVRIVVAVIEAFNFNVELIEEDEEKKEFEDENEIKNVDEKRTILERINRTILPRLTKCLDSQTHAIEKNARTTETKSTALHLDIQRTPIALAIVKLLQKLPEEVSGNYLHGVILKLCNLMMTHSYDVRETARKTLIQIVKCLGPNYLASVITEISLTMTKGFQNYVAIFSVHTLIVSMKDQIKTGDLDAAISVILKMCIKDQFHSTEEKENGTIKAECPEAKGNRIPETMQHIGRIVSPAAIKLVLTPFREVVNEQPSAKSIQKVSELLSKFASGLKDNDELDHTQLLTFIFKSLKSDLQKLADVEAKNEKTDEKNASRRPESCLILPAAPQRIGAMAKVVIRSRDHVFAEFFVQLLAVLLKEKKLDITDETMVGKLNPFVTLILDCFEFKYENLISCSLRALCSMIQMQLPSIGANSQRVSDTLFILLSDYASIGQAGNKPAIIQLNQLIYKGFTSLISTSGTDFLDNDKLTLLLAYAEADVLDQQKQATMFSLIKTLVKKGVRHERIPEIMENLSETAIRSPLVNIRAQCRETLLDYIGGASDEEKNVNKHIEFFLDQLDYEYETGRQSAAEMLAAVFKNLLAKSLEGVHMLCVVKLGAAMMNDESEKVSAQVGIALRNLFATVGTAQKNETFEVICEWLATDNENAKAVGVQTAVQLSFVEKEAFAGKAEIILNKVEKFLFDEEVFENLSEEIIITILTGMTKILSNAGKQVLEKINGAQFIESLGDLCKCEESVKIMHSASALVGQILSFVEPSEISTELAKEVCLWMCRALRHENLDTPTGEQASKNIVFLTKIVDIETYRVVIGNVAASCRYEIKHQVKQVIKRINCFKLVAALFMTGDEEKMTIILDMFMAILVRELRIGANEELNTLTQEVCSLIKRKIGEEDYGNRVALCQKTAAGKNMDRKRKIRELAVTAPDDAAEIRRKKNKKKTETRKRKIDEMKPYRLMKRRNAEKRKAQQNEE